MLFYTKLWTAFHRITNNSPRIEVYHSLWKGYNNPKHERIAAILGECNCPDYVQKMISNALLKDRTLYSVHFYIGTLEFGYKDR